MTQPDNSAGWYPDPYEQALERYWDGERWESETRPRASLPSAQASTSQDRPLAGPARSAGPLWPVITVVAGVAMALGSFLPWTTLTGSFGERASVAGIGRGNDGWLSFAFGLILVVAGAVSVPRPQRVATLIVDIGALAAALQTIYEIGHVTTESGVLSAGNAVGIYDVGVGLGLGLVAVAAVVALISAAGVTGRDARAAVG